MTVHAGGAKVEPQTSDAAVQVKTGKTWGEWLAVLDDAGCREKDHKGIVAYLHAHFPEIGGWWAQMVTVTYEQARGLRAKHERPDGFAVSASKTVTAPLSSLYGAWADAATRRRWLPDTEITVRKATPDKTLRLTWVDGATTVDVRFTARGTDKSHVAVQHERLADAGEAARMKAYWREALERLRTAVEA